MRCARERGAEIGLQERVVEAPILEAGPRPNVAHRAAFEDTPPIEVGDWMLIEQVLTAIAQVDPHQRHAISTAVGQRPGIARVHRIPEDAHVISVGAADRLAPAAHAIRDLGDPAGVRQATEAHAQAIGLRHRPPANVAGILCEQRELPGREVQPVEVEHPPGAPRVADDDRVGIVAERADELDAHAIERCQIPGDGVRRVCVHGEEMSIFIAVSVHQEQKTLSVAAPSVGVRAGPGGARLARRLNNACGALVEAPEMQSGAASVYCDPSKPGAVGRYPIVPAGVRIGKKDVQGQKRSLFRRTGAGGDRDEEHCHERQHRTLHTHRFLPRWRTALTASGGTNVLRHHSFPVLDKRGRACAFPRHKYRGSFIIMHRYRTHTCGFLREGDIGKEVRLSGWCHRIRDHGGLLFIDLRDHYGLTQVVADPDSPSFKEAEKLRSEWVVRIDGKVRKRPAGTENPDLPTGAVEVYISEIEVLGPAGELPMPVFGDQEYPEDIRLTYRFLDLRRERLHRNIMMRGAVIDSIRRRMKEQGFFEFQTPILTASSPEGARDYLVPSRLHPGKFYALPQAPQQFKQLIMVAGFDRYFQIAPCFRDEDARADRSPGEFYQLDIEMSFVTQQDVFDAVEPVMRGVFQEFSDFAVTPPPFPRIAYDDAMAMYGSDKPDLRNPIKAADVTEIFRGSEFAVFARAVEEGAVVRAIRAPGAGEKSRSFFDKTVGLAETLGLGGLAYIVAAETPKGPLAKYLPEDRRTRVFDAAGVQP